MPATPSARPCSVWRRRCTPIRCAADAVTASVGAEAITLIDPKLQPLLTDGVHLDFAGALDETGAITADHLSLDAGAVALALQGSATGWGDATAHLEGTASVGDLGPALAVAGLKGGGAFAATMKLDKQAEVLAADLDATLSKASLAFRPSMACSHRKLK